MPFVHIDWVSGQSSEKQAEVARRVNAAVSEVTGIAPNDIWVVFQEVPADAWYVGDRSVEQIKSGGT